MNTENYSDYSDIHNREVIARILGVRMCPVDKHGVPLINIRQQRVHKVLPPNFFGVIYTPRLEICDENGLVLRLGINYRGIDDQTYKAYPEIQRVCPRCYSVFVVFERETGRLVSKHLMHGYYKFGGSAKDENSNISTSGLFEQASLSEADRVVITEKANGKAAVMSMFRFRDELFFFGGSKKDHYVAPVNAGMKTLERLNRNLFAYYIFDVFFRIWDGLSSRSKTELADRLCGEKGSHGYTLCAEYEDGRHMVPLPLDSEGKMVNDGLKMFGLVKNCGPIRKGVTLCEDVSKTLSWFDSIGLPHTPYYIKDIDEFWAIKELLREGSLKEGYVLHYQKKTSTGDFITIAVEKYKIWWYIVLRLLREFMRHKKLGRRWPDMLWDRLRNRNEAYMKMPFPMLQKWYNLLCQFVKWFIRKKYNKHFELIGFESGSLGMGTMWREFLWDFPKIDDTFGFCKNPIQLASYKFKKGLISTTKNNEFRPSLIIFQGIPGLGKTTLSAELKKLIESKDILAAFLEQDDFAESENPSLACFNAFRTILQQKTINLLFLMRNNANLEQFRKYAQLAKQNSWEVHVFAPNFLKEKIHLPLVCLQSVYQRHFLQNHPTFKKLELSKQFAITMAFLAEYKIAEKSNIINSVTKIDWIFDNALNNKMPIFLLHKTAEYFRDMLRHFSEAENPFLAREIDSEEIVDFLMFEKKNYQTWRKPSSEIAIETLEKFEKIRNSPAAKPDRKKPAFKKNFEITEDMLYIAVVFDEQSQSLLNKALLNLPFETTVLLPQQMDHLTLIHSSKGLKGSKIWKDLLPLAHLKKELGVVIKGAAFWPKTLLCFTAEVRSEVGENKGKSLLNSVYSRHPHVTAMLGRNVRPIESIRLLEFLADQQEGEKDREGRDFIKLESNIVIKGIVTVIYKNKFGQF